MSYLSFSFAVMVAVLLLFYYLIPAKWNFRYFVLLLGSLFFYCSFDLKYLLFLLFTAFSTFLCAIQIEKRKHRKLILILCLAANITIWFSVKALPWTMTALENLLHLFGVSYSFDLSQILVPVGISYFTLQAIAYLVDIYKEKHTAQRDFLKFFLFISYFPAIVQGPISRYEELMPQLLNQDAISYNKIRKGLFLVLLGLVKKMVIADRLGIFVNDCFESYAQLSGFTLYLSAISYSIQLYADFSGCVDICRGVSSLFNIELTYNFNRPYLATSIRDFWKKWHISLSRWLMDYVYIPLGGSRKGHNRKYINLMITFLVSGLWHGAGPNFFFWGALHGLYQIIGQVTSGFREKVRQIVSVEKGSVSEHIYKVIITFHLVTFAWIFFRASTMMEGINYVIHMFSEFNLRGGLFELSQNLQYAVVMLSNLLVLLFFEINTKSQDKAVNDILEMHLVLRWGIYLVMIFDLLLFGVYGNGYDMSGFLYGGF